MLQITKLFDLQEKGGIQKDYILFCWSKGWSKWLEQSN